MSETSQVRTRFAPSPTGFLHIGSLRTALYTYLFAKQNNGQFILRLEDTDVKRLVPGAAEAIYSGLKWAGLDYDEGPDKGGPFGPYVQSERLKLYKKQAQKLLDKDQAYYCFCSEETLEQMRQEQIAAKQAPKYDRRCLKLSKGEIEKKLKAGEPRTIRMKVPDGRTIEFNDIVRGKIKYNSDELDDQVLLKSDGYPTYFLAAVVDDHLMQISHVTRTEEWLSSTPKLILLYEFLDWEPPQWAHLPLLLNEDRTKMSKRKGDVAVEDYIKKGYLPQALVNYLAFLGWNPGGEKEIFSMQELLKEFRLEKVHKAGAVFNIEKLNWYNAHYIKYLSIEALTEMCLPFLEQAGLIKINNAKTGGQIPLEFIKKIIVLEQERLEYLAQIGEHVAFFFELPEYGKELLKWKEMNDEQVKKSLQASQKIISQIPNQDFKAEGLKSALMSEAEAYSSRGELLWPLRVALSGQQKSPPPFDIASILGKQESVKRIELAIKKLA